MPEEHVPKVVSAHWFGGPDNLPPNTTYIGRPSSYGNRYSSKSGQYTREECIALHRIDFYRSLTQNPSRLAQVKADLGGHDLACWCKQPKRIVGCHGDTYLHILSETNAKRDYTKSVVHYLMEDLRNVLALVYAKIRTDWSGDDQFWLCEHFDELKACGVEYVLLKSRQWNPPTSALEFLLAQMVVDLELAYQETLRDQFEFRLDHTQWVIDRFITGKEDRSREPIPPDLPLTRKPKGKTSC